MSSSMRSGSGEPGRDDLPLDCGIDARRWSYRVGSHGIPSERPLDHPITATYVCPLRNDAAAVVDVAPVPSTYPRVVSPVASVLTIRICRCPLVSVKESAASAPRPLPRSASTGQQRPGNHGGPVGSRSLWERLVRTSRWYPSMHQDPPAGIVHGTRRDAAAWLFAIFPVGAHACRDAQCSGSRGAGVKVSVNISARQFHDSRLVSEVKKAVARVTSIPASSLSS